MILFVTNLDIYLFRADIFPLRPSEFLLPLFFVSSLAAFKLEVILSAFKTHTFKFFLIFALLSILYSIGTDANSEVVKTTIVNSIFSLFIYVFSMAFFLDSDKSLITKFFIVSLILLALSIWYDTFIGLNENSDQLRKGGFAENPNIGASALKFIGFGLLLLYRNSKYQIIILFAILTTVFITFSRGGILSVIIIAVLLILNNWDYNFNLKIDSVIITALKSIGIIVITYFAFVFMANIIQKEIPSFAQGEAGERINLILGNKSSKFEVNGGDLYDSRSNVAEKYRGLFLDNPFGYGTGYTSDGKINKIDTHNYYLKSGVDYGIFGFLTLMAFLLYSLISGVKKNIFFYFIFALLIIMECFVSHGLFLEKAILITLAFMDSKLYQTQKIE